MEDNIANRLRELAKAKGGNLSALGQMSDISVSTLHAVASGRSKPGYDFVVKLHEAFPDLNLDWLITGKGEMLKGRSLVIQQIEETAPAPAAFPQNDSACWDLLKREEEQHRQLRNDYHELKLALQVVNHEHSALLSKLKHLASEDLLKRLGIS